MGFFALSSAWLLLLIPPLVALYFLKLKRPRLDIPSLVLWRQVLEDRRVNSPFQKFKRHILLWLQLLLLVLLILAAMQPYWRGGPGAAANLPILIDHSASMAALDRPGGQSRLEAAKERVREVIDGLRPEQRVSIIAFAGTARRLTDFTDNPRLLRDALDRLEVEDVPSNLEDALRIAQAMSQRTPFEEALLFSDGNFPAETDVPQSFRVNYQKLDPAGANVGVAALTARRGETTRDAAAWDVFVNVEASGEQAVTTVVRVLQDDAAIGERVVEVAGGKAERLMFPVSVAAPSEVRVELRPQGFDALAADNEARLRLEPARPIAVYVRPSMLVFRAALGAIPGVRVYPENGQDAAAAAAFDLVVTDDAADAAKLAPVALFVGVLPDDVKPLMSVDEEGTSVVDWLRNDPVLAHVQWGDVITLENPVSKPEVRENNFEALGYEVLVHGQRGPLMLRKRDAGRTTLHLLFHTDRSTLPYRVGFPVLLSNVVRLAMQEAGVLEAEGAKTGVLPMLAGRPPEREFTVKGPAGERTMKSDAQGQLAGVPAPKAGVYRITGPDTDVAVGASLLSAAETGLQGVDRIQFSELSVAAATGDVEVDHPLWRWLALAVLAVLLIEWWFFQKRARVVRGVA